MPMTEEQKKLVEDNINFAWHLTHKWAKKSVFNFDIDEIFSMFSFALCKAAFTFRDDKGVKFTTYAAKCMENEIRMAFNKKKRSGENMGLSLIGDDKFRKEVDNAKIIKNKEHLKYDKVLDLMVLEDAFKALTDREEKILRLRYYEEITQREIACILNMSRSYISRIESKTLSKLHKWYMIDN